MVTSYAIRLIQQEAESTLQKLGNGQFGRDHGDKAAMELVQYRKGLLKALELLRAKTPPDMED